MCFVISCLQWVFFSSLKEINRLRRKAMGNTYLKVTVEKD